MGVGGFSSTEVQQRSVRRARWLGYDGWAYVDGFTGDGAERVRHVKCERKQLLTSALPQRLASTHLTIDNPSPAADTVGANGATARDGLP